MSVYSHEASFQKTMGQPGQMGIKMVFHGHKRTKKSLGNLIRNVLITTLSLLTMIFLF